MESEQKENKKPEIKQAKESFQKKPKLTKEEEIKQVKLKSIEKECLDKVFRTLCDLGSYI
jgi:hypothetical protein